MKVSQDGPAESDGPVVSAQDAAHFDTECQRDLLGNPRTAPAGIPLLGGDDGVDEFLGAGTRARPRTTMERPQPARFRRGIKRLFPDLPNPAKPEPNRPERRKLEPRQKHTEGLSTLPPAHTAEDFLPETRRIQMLRY